MELEDYINHSGGANGSDSSWDDIGFEFGMCTNRHYYGEGKKTPRGNTPLTREQLLEADPYLKLANKTLKRTFPSRSEFVNDLLRRNWYQVKNSEAVFAISTITDNRVDGGTGWAVHMAIAVKKPVFVFDQVKEKWFTWNGETFVEAETPVLTKNFAGIGTRRITEAGERAIREIYKKTKDFK